MSDPDRLPAAERHVRILRLIAALSVAVALIAVAAIAKGGLAPGGQRLVIVAIALGACALVGMSVIALPYALRQKDKNDPRP
jgi:peptidoglycan/LPS O-acetylase OafA/YrhL